MTVNDQLQQVRGAELYSIELPMLDVLAASHGRIATRPLTLVHLTMDDGTEGWGECSALADASYNGESAAASFDALSEGLDVLFAQPAQYSAKSAVRTALLDAELHKRQTPLSAYLGAISSRVIAMGVVGISDVAQTLSDVQRLWTMGYREFKIKIAPGHDVDRMNALAETFPDVKFRVDANGSYEWPRDRAALRSLKADSIEQPFAVGREKDSAELFIPVWLDESASTGAIADGLVVKFGNLGGLGPAGALIASARDTEMKVSVGGMLDGGISRAVNIALAATYDFANAPAEVAPDGRWFARNYTREVVTLEDGTIAVPNHVGIGATVDRDALDDLTIQHVTL